MVTSDGILEKDEEEEEPTEQSEPSLEMGEITGTIEVSLNLVVGLSPPKTMKIKGYIREHPVVTLMESPFTSKGEYVFIWNHLGFNGLYSWRRHMSWGEVGVIRD